MMESLQSVRQQWSTVCSLGIFLSLSSFGLAGAPGEVTSPPSPASPMRGYELLRTKPYLPADFDEQVLSGLWRTWPQKERKEAASLDEAGRRRWIFDRYGLHPAPEDAETDTVSPLGYVVTESGWVMNCFTCHGGRVNGEVMPGAPNTTLDLQTLTEDVRQTKLRQFKKLTHLDVASLSMSLGGSIGTTNAVMFGVALGIYRDPDMEVIPPKANVKLVDHDMDAPPWWNVHKKSRLYIDGFAPKSHRVIMQFMMLPSNDGERFRGWEEDYRHILAYIDSLRPPRYPFPIDTALAKRGRQAFEQHCSTCHGTYGDDWTYPEVTVPIDEIGTDPVRLQSLTPLHRQWMAKGWMSRFGADAVETDPGGYVAPPLDGIWASAPYFHNGSVPTLWHILNPSERPVVWERTSDEFDQSRVGLSVREVDEVPPDAPPRELRRLFDTRRFGKSATGHLFPDRLTDDEKRAVLEYLKTL